MTTAIKRRRGTTAQHSTFTGLEGEITVDTTKDTVVVHDGATAGGFALLREDLSNNTNVSTPSNTQTLSNKTINLSSNTLTGTTAQFNTALTDADFATLDGTETLSNKTFSTNPTISAGTANGLAYLNGSKVLTTGSALTFDGANVAVNGTTNNITLRAVSTSNTVELQSRPDISCSRLISSSYLLDFATVTNQPILFTVNSSEQMRLTNTGLGIGSSAPTSKLQVVGLPVYANNAAAIAGGLTAGAFYRTGSDPDPVCVVH